MLSGVNTFDLERVNKETDRKAEIEMVETVFKSIFNDPDAATKKIEETKAVHDAALALSEFSNSSRKRPLEQ